MIADERVADRFTAPGDEIERLDYGFSILHCVPVANLDEDSAATGTVIRSDTVRTYATDAASAASTSCQSTTTSGASICSPTENLRHLA